MNKEQFKISISNLINYYLNNIIPLNVDAATIQGNAEIKVMIHDQAQILPQSFQVNLEKAIDSFAEYYENVEEEEVDE